MTLINIEINKEEYETIKRSLRGLKMIANGDKKGFALIYQCALMIEPELNLGSSDESKTDDIPWEGCKNPVFLKHIENAERSWNDADIQKYRGRVFFSMEMEEASVRMFEIILDLIIRIIVGQWGEMKSWFYGSEKCPYVIDTDDTSMHRNDIVRCYQKKNGFGIFSPYVSYETQKMYCFLKIWSSESSRSAGGYPLESVLENIYRKKALPVVEFPYIARFIVFSNYQGGRNKELDKFISKFRVHGSFVEKPGLRGYYVFDENPYKPVVLYKETKIFVRRNGCVTLV